LYRSDDGGQTWAALDRSQMMIWRPFYFANLIVDPKDENKIYKAGSVDMEMPYRVYGGLQDNSILGWRFSISGRNHQQSLGKYVWGRRLLDVR